jgi:hypothetical protein
MELINALLALNPNHSWAVDKNSYDGIIWGDMPESERPTKEVVEAKLQELIDAQPLKDLRAERDRRLAAVDWVTSRATSTETPVPQEWKTYMQALRDLPATTEDPTNPEWPPVPA